MNASRLILSLSTALSLFVIGCSSPCESVCASFNECELDERDHDVDCATYCGRVEQFQEKAASSGADTCQTEFDAYVSCWETNIADICDAENTKCDASLTAWTGCVDKFCAIEANATDQACVVVGDDPDTEEPEPAGVTAFDGF